jgi:hypothetical protein
MYRDVSSSFLKGDRIEDVSSGENVGERWKVLNLLLEDTKS